MFSNKTVFVLGAGASWHYGYPTGEELVQKVQEKARVFADHCLKTAQQGDRTIIASVPAFLARNSPQGFPGGPAEMKRAWEAGHREAEDLLQRLDAVDPVVIDYFLGHNRGLQDIGKFLIAWVLLEAEAAYNKQGLNPNRREALRRSTDLNDIQKAADLSALCNFKDNWYRFLVHKLTVGCSRSSDLLDKNDVIFVTFNYDVSLEYRLFRALSAISLFNGTDAVARFFEGARVIHVYGSIREAPFNDPAELPFESASGRHALYRGKDPYGYATAMKDLFDAIYGASTGIRTIAPEEKTGDKVAEAKEAIADAACVYILGYGFDTFNSDLLNLKYTVTENKYIPRCVLFTNYLDGGVVNKRADDLFPTRDRSFLVPGPVVYGGRGHDQYYEKSVRDVYGALSLDFDAPEEWPGLRR